MKLALLWYHIDKLNSLLQNCPERKGSLVLPGERQGGKDRRLGRVACPRLKVRWNLMLGGSAG
jgi:hypothetical protein